MKNKKHLYLEPFSNTSKSIKLVIIIFLHFQSVLVGYASLVFIHSLILYRKLGSFLPISNYTIKKLLNS